VNLAIAAFAAALIPDDPAAEARASIPALWRIMDAAVRRWVPLLLVQNSSSDHAAALRALPVIVDIPTAEAAQRVLGAEAPGVLGTWMALNRAIQGARKEDIDKIREATGRAALIAYEAGEESMADARRLLVELAGGFRG
jgi:hypothetical protein